MTVAAQTSTTYESAGGTSAVIPLPSGTVLGDCLVAVVASALPDPIGAPSPNTGGGFNAGYGGGYVETAPVGGSSAGYPGGYLGGYEQTSVANTSDWTLLGHAESDSNALAVFLKIATAAEPSSYTFPVSTTPTAITGVITRFTGAIGFDVVGPGVASTAAAIGVTLAPITTTYAGDLLLSAYAIDATSGVTAVTPAGMTSLVATSGAGVRVATAYEQRPNLGDTGARTWTYIPTTTGYSQAAVLVALRPSQVTATRQAVWTVRTPVATTRATAWAVAGKPGVTKATTWATRANVVPTARSTTWSDLVVVTAFRSTSWQIAADATTATFTPGCHLVVYAPNGARLGDLPAPQGISFADPLNDVPGLTFTYLVRAPVSNLLGQACEIAVELSPDGGNTWLEPTDGRFLYWTDGRNPLDRVDAYSVTGIGYVQRFDKADVYPNGVINADGNREFLSLTPGQILDLLFREAQARGALTGIAWSFTSAQDSAGQAWAKRLTIYYTPGISYLQVIRNMADQGFIDFRMSGRTLHVYNADTALATDRTVGSGPVTLLSGRDLTEAPFQRTWEALADSYYIQGDEGHSLTYTNPAAVKPWGRQEAYIANGSVTDTGTMTFLVQAAAAQTDNARTSYTRGLDFTRSPFMPFRHYSPGDFILSSVDGTALPEKLRIRQITLTVNEQNVVAGNVVLNDRFLEADIRAQRRVEGITNGASGNAPLPGTNPDTTDKTVPGKVAGLVVGSDAYLLNSGYTNSLFDLAWGTVTTNTDGTPCDDLDHYEIFAHPGPSGIASRRQVAITDDTSLTLSGYQPNTTWWFSVRAVDHAGHRGALSNEVLGTAEDDLTPPQAPSAPVVTVRLGVLNVYWDGTPATGSWPRDFDHVEVHYSTTSLFTPTTTTYFDHLYQRGSTVIAGGAYGVPLYVRLVAIDKTGLASLPSDQAIGVPARLVGTDLDPGAITYQQIGFKDLDNLILDGSFESAPFQAAVAARSDPAWTFTSADAYLGSTSATINAADGPSASRVLMLMQPGDDQTVRPAEKLLCRYAYKSTTLTNGALRLVVTWTLTGGGTSTSTLAAPPLAGGTWQQAAQQIAAPANAVSARINIELTAAATVGSWWVDAVEVRRVVGTTIIEDAAIGNAQIANLAVNDAKIANLSVGKLTAGTLSATVLIGGTIRTASSGARVEMTATGIRLFSATGTLKGHWNPSAGQLRIYNDTDAALSSRGHGLQFGDDNSTNLIIDTNEVMSRLNGGVDLLRLNGEGGTVQIGGIPGGFPTNTYSIPQDAAHQIQLRGSVQIANRGDTDYPSEWPPFMIGEESQFHISMDNNEIQAVNGDNPSDLVINGPSNALTLMGSGQHQAYVVVASNSVRFRRGGNFASGERQGFMTGGDVASDSGIRLEGSRVQIRGNDNTGFRPIDASSFNVNSELRVKQQVGPFDAAKIIRGAGSRRWQYRSHVEREDRWHYGPMVEDLPAELHHSMGRDERGVDTAKGYDLASLVGILWEAVRELLAERDGKR